MTENISEKELLTIIQAGEIPAAAFSSSYTAKLAQALLDARAEIERLREALTFYADDGNYLPCFDGKWRDSAVETDRGEKARAALQPATIVKQCDCELYQTCELCRPTTAGTGLKAELDAAVEEVRQWPEGMKPHRKPAAEGEE